MRGVMKGAYPADVDPNGEFYGVTEISGPVVVRSMTGGPLARANVAKMMIFEGASWTLDYVVANASYVPSSGEVLAHCMVSAVVTVHD